MNQDAALFVLKMQEAFHRAQVAAVIAVVRDGVVHFAAHVDCDELLEADRDAAAEVMDAVVAVASRIAAASAPEAPTEGDLTRGRLGRVGPR